jgi:hypothetical protein
MKSLSLDFYGGMLWCVDKYPPNDIRDTSTSYNIKLVQPRLAFDKSGYDAKNFLNPNFRGPVEFDLFTIFGITRPITITGWEGAVSSFGPIQVNPAHSGMHVDTWLSVGAPTGKMANGVLGELKTGDAGVGIGSNTGLSLYVGGKLYLNYWAHNMRRSLNPLGADDWHVGYVIYYEEN